MVGIVDSNNDPDGITYVIPGNDDSSRAIRFYTNSMADAIIEARASVADGSERVDDFIEIEEKSTEVSSGDDTESQLDEPKGE